MIVLWSDKSSQSQLTSLSKGYQGKCNGKQDRELLGCFGPRRSYLPIRHRFASELAVGVRAPAGQFLLAAESPVAPLRAAMVHHSRHRRRARASLNCCLSDGPLSSTPETAKRPATGMAASGPAPVVITVTISPPQVPGMPCAKGEVGFPSLVLKSKFARLSRRAALRDKKI